MVFVGFLVKGNIYSFKGFFLNNFIVFSFEYVEMNLLINNDREINIKFELIEIGIKVIDFFILIVKGFKLGIFGGVGVGKIVLMKEIIFNVNNKNKNILNIFIGFGECFREGIEFYDELV